MTFTPTAYTPAQTDKAIEAIEDQAVVCVPNFGGTYQIVSSDGTGTYLVDLDHDFCTCPARGKCWHQLATYLFEEGLDALYLTAA